MLDRFGRALGEVFTNYHIRLTNEQFVLLSMCTFYVLMTDVTLDRSAIGYHYIAASLSVFTRFSDLLIGLDPMFLNKF